MAGKSNTKGNAKSTKVVVKKVPNSVAAAEQGITTSAQFKRVFALMIGDVISERMGPSTANAASNVASKLIRMTELEFKYGLSDTGARKRTLQLTA